MSTYQTIVTYVPPSNTTIVNEVADTLVTTTNTVINVTTGCLLHGSTNTNSTIVESNPTFMYTNGIVSRINYASGNYKLFTYTNGMLTQLDYVHGLTTTRKVFSYSNGILINIVQTEV